MSALQYLFYLKGPLILFKMFFKCPRVVFQVQCFLGLPVLLKFTIHSNFWVCSGLFNALGLVFQRFLNLSVLLNRRK